MHEAILLARCGKQVCIVDVAATSLLAGAQGDSSTGRFAGSSAAREMVSRISGWHPFLAGNIQSGGSPTGVGFLSGCRPELLRATVEMFQPQADRRRIQLGIEDEPATTVHCDRARVLQVFSNLAFYVGWPSAMSPMMRAKERSRKPG